MLSVIDLAQRETVTAAQQPSSRLLKYEFLEILKASSSCIDLLLRKLQIGLLRSLTRESVRRYKSLEF